MYGGSFFGSRFFGARYFGKEGLTVPGYYNGSRYFGSRYFGARYFGANSTEIPFELVTTNTPALSGSVQISGDVLSGVGFDLAVTTGLALSGVVSTSGALLYEGDDWAFTPPLSINELTGALVVSGDVAFTLGATEAGSHFGGAYFGQAYFGRRYWATKAAFALEQTNTLALSGSVQVGGDIIAATSVVQSGAVAFTGTLGLTGDLTFPSFNYTSAGVLYLPIRMVSALWSAGGPEGGGEIAWLPPARQPLAYTDARTGQTFCDPTWYRFFEYLAETRLGGKTGPTITSVVQTLTDTQTTAAAATSTVAELQQQTQANAESLYVVRSVAKLNLLDGAEQIPPVEL